MGLITAQLVSDYVTESGERKSSFKVKLPKFMLADFATDSRYTMFIGAEHSNIEYRIQSVHNTAAVPINWEQKDSRKPLGPDCEIYSDIWHQQLDSCLHTARHMNSLPVAPANRTIEALLDPFDHATVTMTSSNWKLVLSEGFYSKFDVEASIVTKHCKEIWGDSTPTKLEEGEMYLPYISEITFEDLSKIINKSIAGDVDVISDFIIASSIKASMGMIYMPRIFDYENQDIVMDAIDGYNSLISEQEMKRIFRDHIFKIQDGDYKKISKNTINQKGNK